MAPQSVEILWAKRPTSAREILSAMHEALEPDCEVRVTEGYEGRCDWLMLWGVGHPSREIARAEHVESGRTAVLWDYGYFRREKAGGYLRVSLNDDHPQAWLDRTGSDPSRWDSHGIKLREDYDPEGPIILVGMAPKSWAYYGDGWEEQKLAELRRRFPGRSIIYRPKPTKRRLALDCGVNQHSSIEDLLRGASLVVCHHSNVAVDAVIAGVPFETEDGAAVWLGDKPFTREHRLDFLQRLSWWQWKPSEAKEAWRFLRCVST